MSTALTFVPPHVVFCGKDSNNQIFPIAVDDTGKVEVAGALVLQGVWDANANDPALSDNGGGGSRGDFYVVSVSGTTTIDGISSWTVGDWIVNNGTIWQKADHTDAVSSIDGRVGAVDGRYSQAIFFGKGGLDSRDGKSYLTRKLTLTSAKTAASALTPAADNQIVINSKDAGTYTESYTNVAYVHLIAPAIKITGNVVCAENCIMQIGTLNGNLTVSASKILRCTIYDITGSVTKTGKIRGQVGNDFYVANIITEV